MSIAAGGVMTADELTEGKHSIREVQVISDGEHVMVRCPCGWTGQRHATTRHASTEWQRHRSVLTRSSGTYQVKGEIQTP